MNTAALDTSDPAPLQRLTIGALAEGFYLAAALRGLFQAGVINLLERQPTSASAIAGELELDESLLTSSLDYLCARTELVTRHGRDYRLTAAPQILNYFTNQYLIAFAPAALGLDTLLVQPETAASLIDREAHSRAFAGQAKPSIPELPSLIRRFQCDALLELGCGSGSLLIELAESNSEFIGWGVDINPAMCDAARLAVSARGLSKRLQIYCADTTVPTQLAQLPIPFDSVQAVSMSSLLNELFAPGNARASQFIADLAQLVPGRIAFISDYYGRLGTELSACAHGLLHDYVQSLSGQGIPPSSVDAWQAVYEEGRGRLIHSYEKHNTSEVNYFIHLVQLN